METNECLENNGGCWANKSANITACKVRTLCLTRELMMQVSVFLLQSLLPNGVNTSGLPYNGLGTYS